MTMQRSSRDATRVPEALEGWLSGLLPEGADPAVSLHDGIDSNGMSSETLVLDATWTEDGRRESHPMVARVAPAPQDFPVFARYELGHQYEVVRQVAELTDVPVPAVRWLEESGEVLGTPFFLMDRVEGVVPPDVLPYPFGDNWLFDADRADQRRLQDATVDVLAQLHAIDDPLGRFGYLAPEQDGETLLHRNLAKVRAWYDFAVRDLAPSPIVERALAWLEANVPTAEEQGDPVLCWGDARIGNVIYRDFEPVAVLDWEMVTLGPRALDVSWLLFAHQVFESIVQMLELPGMPHFLREEDVVAAYAERTGVELGPLDWYFVLHGLQWCVVFMRTGARQVHFGEIEMPADVESLFHCKPLLQSLLTKVGA
ncbi:MAG: phosphotransferase family protein [Actinobacteria bacterium]|nr:phosphotransferase family protein [Actinomycetota bacterium]MBU2110324.1 phosphotransferase family protein [Actinomycetota bacterium]